MLRSYTLLFLMSLSCTSLFGMNNQYLRDRITQTPLLLGAPIRKTGFFETVLRDALCGGFIAPSIMATSMVAAFLANQQEGPCRLCCAEGITGRCFWQGYIALNFIGLAVLLKLLGVTFEVANNHPTERAVGWRDGCRLLYGIATAYVILNSEYFIFFT